MYYIAIDLGGTYIKSAVVDKYGTILSYEKSKTKGDRNSSEIVKDIINQGFKVLESSNLDLSYISHIGMATPGMVDEEKGEIVRINNINLSGINIKKEFQKQIDKPFYISNDANCAALGEYYMLNEKPQTFVMLTLGTGIGGAIIHEGKLLKGINGLSGEIGHMGIVKDGLSCSCGRFGCFEQYASTTALIRMIKERMKEDKNSIFYDIVKGDIEKVDGKTIFIALEENDKEAKEIFKKWIDYLSYGILNIINIYQPNLLLLGGGISKEKDKILNPVIEYVKTNRYCNYPLDLGITKIDIASYGNNAGLIGAGFLNRKV